MCAVFVEPGYGWEDFHDGGAAGAEVSVLESSVDELASLLRFQSLSGDDVAEFGLLAMGYVGSPFLFDRAVQTDGVHKVLNQVLLGSQAWAGVHGPADLSADFFVVTVAPLVTVLLDQHEDVVHVDLDLFDQFDLKDHIVVYVFFFRLASPAELVVQVQIDTAVVLALAVREQLTSGEFIKGRQDVLQAQDRAEEGDELLLGLFANDLGAKRVVAHQAGDFVGVVLVVLHVGLQVNRPGFSGDSAHLIFTSSLALVTPA